MHVISEKKFREFWRKHPRAERPLRKWLTQANQARWQTFADVRQDFPSADQVGKLTVFDISGNNFRLIVHLHFNRGKAYIRAVLTHPEYDQDQWKKDS